MIKKTKDTPGELLYGVNPILELLKAKRRKLIALYTTKPVPESFAKIEPYLPKYPYALQYVQREVLHRMVGVSEHQNFVAWVQPLPTRKKMFNPIEQPYIVLLDGIQDTRNLGAIIRSAYCTGANGIILAKRDNAPLNAATYKASAGLLEHMEIYVTSSSGAAIQELKKAGYTIYLATFEGQNATQVTYASPLCIVIGSEGAGISKSLWNSGTHITLPQCSKDISYNASVAAGILFFIVACQRRII